MRPAIAITPERALWALAGIGMLLFAALQFGGLLANAYDGYGSERRGGRADSVSARAASAFAVQLAPWNAGFHRNLAWSELAAGTPETVVAEARQILSWAAGDPYLSAESTLLLAQAGVFDSRLLAAVRSSSERSPQTRSTQLALALLGLRYWERGDEALRAVWRASIRFSFEHDRERLLQQVIRTQSENRLCGEASLQLDLTQLPDNWCAGVSLFRGLCIRDDLDETQHAWCRAQGFRVQSRKQP